MPLIGLMFGSRIGTIITLVIFGATFFFGWLAVHDNNVWNKATEAFNEAQRALVTKKEEEFKQQTEVINDDAARIRAAIQSHEDKLNDTTNQMEKDAAAESKSTGDKQASDYLKSVVKQLDQTYGQK